MRHALLLLALAAAPAAARNPQKALLKAAGKLDVGGVSKALEEGATPDKAGEPGALRIALLAARPKGETAEFLEIVRALLAKGARIDEKEMAVETPLQWAAEQGYTETVALMMGTITDAKSWSSSWKEAYRAALVQKEVQDRLVALCGSEKNFCPHLLNILISRRDEASVLRLLDAGVDPNEHEEGMTPLYLAALGGDKHMAELLLARGAKVASPSAEAHFEPLGGALSTGQTAIAELLLDRGADPERARASLERLPHEKPAIRLLDQILKKRAPKEPAPAATTASPAAASAGVSKQELAEMIKAAVKEGKPAATAEPAPSALKSDIDAPRYRKPERPRDFAVIVGVEKYSEIPPAQFAERDAAAFKAHMLALGLPERNVVLLSDEKAGYKSMEKFVEVWLPRNAAEGSRVYFYFSGHGAPDPATGEAFLLPWDGDPSFLENTGYPVKRLYSKLGALKAKEIVVALDACFSGAGGRSVLAKGARPLVASVQQAETGAKLTVFAAAAGNQITSTRDDQGHGTFTYHFLKGLSGAAKDKSGAVTAGSLQDYLQPKVADDARRQNREQTPTRRGAAPDLVLTSFN
jgi:hypothetical protein